MALTRCRGKIKKARVKQKLRKMLLLYPRFVFDNGWDEKRKPQGKPLKVQRRNHALRNRYPVTVRPCPVRCAYSCAAFFKQLSRAVPAQLFCVLRELILQ